MSECGITNDATGNRSELQDELLRVLKNADEATETYNKIKGSDFEKVFGPWVENYNSESPEKVGNTYPTGEPMLHKRGDTNQYYFILADGTRMYLDKEGLRREFSSKEIKEVTKFLLYKYANRGQLKSLNEFEDNATTKQTISDIIELAMSEYKLQVNKAYEGEDRDEFLRRADLVMNYQDEFRSELIFAIQSLGETIREVAEEDKGGGVNITESITVNPKTSATVNTKIMLSQILDKEKVDYPNDIGVEEEDGTFYLYDNATDELIGQTSSKEESFDMARELSKTKEYTQDKQSGYLATDSFLSLNEVWSVLQPMLSDMVTTGSKKDVISAYSKMKKKLVERTPIHPWMSGLLDTLDQMEKENSYKTKEFVQAFNKTKINYYVTEFDDSDNSYKVINATATNSRASQTLDVWGQRFRDEYLDNFGNLLPEQADRIKLLGDQLKAIKARYNNQLKIDSTSTFHVGESISEAFLELIPVMRQMGIFGVKHGDINSMILLTGGTDNQLDTMSNLFTGLQESVAFITEPGKEFTDNGDAVNPYRTEKYIRTLADATSQRDTDTAESNIVANDNKQYFAYSNPTYVSNKIAGWLEDPSELENMASLPYHKHSRWAQHLLANDTDLSGKNKKKMSQMRLEGLKAGLASSFKSKGKSDGVDNTKISYEDQLHDNIFKVLGSRVRGGKSYFSTITPADKSRFMQFEGLPFFESGIRSSNGQTKIHKDTIDVMFNYFTDEYNRMKDVKRELRVLPDNEKVVHYHTGLVNGLKSQLFPELSHDNKDEKYQAIRNILYSADNSPHTEEQGVTGEQKLLIREAIEASLLERVAEAEIELNKLNAIDPRLLGAYSNDMTALTGDYIVNGIISGVEYTKLFSGDPAYFKNLPELTKRVPATYSDGLQLSLENGDNLIYNVAIVEGVEVSSRYVEKIRESLNDKSIAAAYEVDKNGKGGVNTTDAQAWITPRRWRFLKQRLGQWSDLHDSVYAKMLTGEAITDKTELKLAAQPMKGVYFYINNGVPTYLKYSQAVMIPSLVKGTPMQRLYDKMVTNPDTGNEYTDAEAHLEIHETITIDGIKVGAIAPTKINKGDTTDLAENFELNKVELDNRGWKLQQDLPVKTMHETNIGSQIQKNILDGLNKKAKYKIGEEKPVEGTVLLQRIHDAISVLSNIGKKEISDKLGIVDNKIGNKEALYDALIDEFRSRGGNENIISALEKETPFDAIPQIRGRVDSILMSMFNKAITKISTEGGSYIQVSPFGFETLFEDKVTNALTLEEERDLERLTAEKESLESNITYITLQGIPKITPESAKKETGAGIGMSKDINISWLNKNGVSVEKAAEQIVQDNESYGLDVQDIRNEIIELLTLRKSDVMESLFDEKEFNRLTKKSKEKPIVKKGINESDIKIVSKRFNGKALLPPRRGLDGQTLPGQAMIPHSLAMKILKENGKDIDKITNEEWLKIFSPKALEIISYRIPNQGMSSNDSLEIVGILPPGMGDGIIGYDGIPAKTGSDFDIDKMFVMAPNLVFNKDSGQIEVLSEDNKKFFSKKKAVEGEPDSPRLVKQLAQNNVIELYTAVLQSPNTYDNMMTSIDADFLKKDILKLFPAPAQTNMGFFSPIYQLKTKMDYMSGKMGVALTANQLVDHVANQSLYITMLQSLGIAGNKGKTPMDRPKKGTSIATTLSAFLNAYVDIAKDPYVSRGNHNDVTANVAFMLIRAGVEVQYLNRFIGQPILKEYVNLKRRQDSITGEALEIDNEYVSAAKYLLKSNGWAEDTMATGKLKAISAESLEDNMSERSEETDAIILNAFIEYEETAARFTEAVLAAKSDTKGSGGSPVDLVVLKNKRTKVIDSKFLAGYESKFQGTALGTYQKNSIEWVHEVLNKSKVLLSGTYAYEDMLNQVSSSLGKGDLMASTEFAKSVSNGVYSYLMSGTKMFTDNRQEFSRLFQEFPETIKKLKESDPDNFLIKELEIQTRGGFDFLGINNKNKPVDYQNDIYRAWLDLYRDPSTKDVAIDLAKYSYSQSGFQPNLNQFFSYIPHEILKAEGMNSDVNAMFGDIETVRFSKHFVSQYIRHNSEDRSIVPVIKPPVLNDRIDAGFYGEAHTVAEVKAKKKHSQFLSVHFGKDDSALYELEGINEDGVPMYLRTHKLGYTAGKNKVFEYSYEKKTQHSVVSFNNFEGNLFLLAEISKKRAIFNGEAANIEGTNISKADVAQETAQEAADPFVEQEGQLEMEFGEFSNDFTLTPEQLKTLAAQQKFKDDEGISDPDCQ